MPMPVHQARSLRSRLLQLLIRALGLGGVIVALLALRKRLALQNAHGDGGGGATATATVTEAEAAAAAATKPEAAAQPSQRPPEAHQRAAGAAPPSASTPTQAKGAAGAAAAAAASGGANKTPAAERAPPPRAVPAPMRTAATSLEARLLARPVAATEAGLEAAVSSATLKELDLKSGSMVLLAPEPNASGGGGGGGGGGGRTQSVRIYAFAPSSVAATSSPPAERVVYCSPLLLHNLGGGAVPAALAGGAPSPLRLAVLVPDGAAASAPAAADAEDPDVAVVALDF